MIFHDLKLIFMHTERTGGVALRKYLLQYETNFIRPNPHTKHLTCDEAKELIDPKVWNEYTKIGFVRNPYDRLVSWYHACKKNRYNWRSDLAIHVNKCNSFEELVKNPNDKIILSQYQKVKDCDFIFRFENYDEEVKHLSTILNIPYQHVIDNTSEHKEYREYYTPELQEIARVLFAKDLKEFNYDF